MLPPSGPGSAAAADAPAAVGVASGAAVAAVASAGAVASDPALPRRAGPGSSRPTGPAIRPRGIVDRILAARGWTDAAEIQAFLDPRLDRMHDPALMPGVDAAAERIVRAIRGGESIVVYGDYDVDGMTATAILWHVLRSLDPDVRIRSYVPHRLEEGYGLNAPALEQLAADGADLVITVDCGVTAVAEVAAGRAAGLDMIVTDHHEPPEGDAPWPDATIVHPRAPGSSYPFADLCGAGVAFKLAWRTAQHFGGSDRVGDSARRALVDVMPLVALGTIADVVPLVDENRVITSFGLRTLRATPIAGLQALVAASGLTGREIDDEKVGFVLAPRLNACGRMGHAREAVRLFTDADPSETPAIAADLTRQNEQRQRTERAILDAAVDMAIAAGMNRDDRRAIVLAHPDWHPGVVGIVCSRLVERFGRPAILLQDDGEGELRGSARSIEGYSIHAGLTACADLLTRFGGHEAAAGLTMPAANLPAFTDSLLAHAASHITAEQLVPRLRLDCDVALEELTPDTVSAIARLGPFGRGNPRPVLRLPTVRLEAVRTIGSEGKHVELRVKGEAGGRSGGTLRAIWFGGAEAAGELVPGMRLDLALQPRMNTWRGRTSVEAHLKDVRVVQ
ncbi:MAG: single-stranded-DNA-specific exonuclease RecJ [Phycisphaerales bacterium]